MPLKAPFTVVTLGLVLVIATGGAARAESPVEPGKLFVGPEGMTVAIVPLKPRTDLRQNPRTGSEPPAMRSDEQSSSSRDANRKVLVQVTGSGSAFDGKALPPHRRRQRRNARQLRDHLPGARVQHGRRARRAVLRVPAGTP